MKSGLPPFQRGRETVSHSVGGNFISKGAGKDCLFHTSRTEEWERKSLIDLEVRLPLGSCWIHVHFEGCQELMQLLTESPSMVPLFPHLSLFQFSICTKSWIPWKPLLQSEDPFFQESVRTIQHYGRLSGCWKIIYFLINPCWLLLINLYRDIKKILPFIITQWLTIELCYESNEIEDDCLLKFPSIVFWTLNIKDQTNIELKEKFSCFSICTKNF